MKLNATILLCLVALLSACSTPMIKPTSSSVDNSRIYEASYDQVWSTIIRSIAQSGLNITTLEKDSGIVAVSEAGYDPGWANEGTLGSTMGVPDQVIDRRASLNIIANELGPERTQVQVNSQMRIYVQSGNGSAAFPYRSQWVTTYSNGTMENRILGGIARRLHEQYGIDTADSQ